MSRLPREVRQFLHAQAAREGPGVVAVSGGADSVALLRALEAVPVQPLVVAHIDHRLRGSESDRDAEFVQELAARLGLPCRVKVVDIASLGGNMEATARRVRYEFLAEVAAETSARWIATGHTAGDQAETVLLRLIRGSGLQGLRGIAAKRISRDPTVTQGRAIIRPLLSVTRAEVLEYLSEIGQPFREDATNADSRFSRNRVRHELLPMLETFNPDVVTALAHLASQAGEAFEVLEASAIALLGTAERPRAGARIILDAAVLAAAHPYMVREAIRHLWQREGWPVSEMSAAHWTRVVAIVRGDLRTADFPAGIRASHAGRVVRIGPGE